MQEFLNKKTGKIYTFKPVYFIGESQFEQSTQKLGDKEFPDMLLAA